MATSPTLPEPASLEPVDLDPEPELPRWEVTSPPPGDMAATRPRGALPSGSVVAGKYVVGPLIGRGGSSLVLRAVGPMERDVALKVQTPAAAADPRMRERFRREMRILATLDHPSIVRVFEAGTLPSGALVAALELLEGLTLQHTLAVERRITQPRAVGIAVQVLSALGEVHARGVVHRDLKPANIMLSWPRSGERVKLLDFGVAKSVAEGTRALTTGTEIIGTPGYLSPEQVIAGATVDARSDLFTVGVLLFEMLTGQRAFGSATGELVAEVSNGAPSARARLAEHASAELVAIVMRLIAASPDERFASAKDAVTALSQIDHMPAPPASTRPPPRSAPSVLVVSTKKIRNDHWCQTVTSLGREAISVSEPAKVLPLLAAPRRSAWVVMLDMHGGIDPTLVRAIHAASADVVGRILHVVRAPLPAGTAAFSDRRTRTLPMPVTEADLQAALEGE